MNRGAVMTVSSQKRHILMGRAGNWSGVLPLRKQLAGVFIHLCLSVRQSSIELFLTEVE